jgi:hypothetical protein
LTNEDQNNKKEVSVLGQAADDVIYLFQFVDVCTSGLLSAAEATRHVELVREMDEVLRKSNPRFPDADSFEKAFKSAQVIETFAKEEFRLGFPYLFSTATIRLWSILESAIDDLIVDALRTRSEVRMLPAFKKLKGPLIEFVTAPADNQAAFLTDLLKEHVSASLKPGVGRFEALLDCVGLGGPVAKVVRRTLLELSEVRHALIHRLGKVDAKLKERCPWLPLQLGERLNITKPIFISYYRAVIWYVLEVDERVVRMIGETLLPGHREHRESHEKSLLQETPWSPSVSES